MTIAHQKMIRELERRYGNVLYERDGLTYPTAVIRVDENTPILSPNHPTTFADDFAIYDHDHLQSRIDSAAMMTNNVTYVLDKITQNPVQIHAKLGRYFDMIATCDAIDHELRRFTRGEVTTLPLRDALHKRISSQDTLTDGAGRSALIGVATTTVFKQGGQYKAILGQRSQQVATGAGLFHVVPAFVFQPSANPAFHSAEWSVEHQVLREVGEELFGMPEVEGWQSVKEADYFYQYPAIAELRQMLIKGRAEHHITGIAINLLTLRPEICTLLLIHDEAWYTHHKTELRAACFERRNTVFVPIDTLEGLPQNPHETMTPHGAVSFWLGVDRARSITR